MDQAGSGQDAPTFTIQPADGTSIAVWTEGAGPPLVLVHGSIFDHRLLAPLVAYLGDSFTTYAMNRRGFPPSGDGASYSVEQEFEDVAAVIEEVGSRTGQPVALFGHSYGASCAMGGAALSGKVHRLILYEPSLGMPYPPGLIRTMERSMDEGRPEEVIRGVIVEALNAPEEEFAALRDSPQWADCLAAAPTALREARAEGEWTFQPGVMDSITSPTLMLVGTESPAPLHKSMLLAMAELQSARLHVLKGHGHGAFLEDPAMVAEVIKRFLGESGHVQGRPQSSYSAAP